MQRGDKVRLSLPRRGIGVHAYVVSLPGQSYHDFADRFGIAASGMYTVYYVLDGRGYIDVVAADRVSPISYCEV